MTVRPIGMAWLLATGSAVATAPATALSRHRQPVDRELFGRRGFFRDG